MGTLRPRRSELPDASRMEVQSIGKVAKLTDILWFSHMF